VNGWWRQQAEGQEEGMSNDFLFDAFARSFEARREAEMSLAE